MTEALKEYRRLERKLISIRWLHQGLESRDEEAAVEELADAWWPLSTGERAAIRAEGPKTLLRSAGDGAGRVFRRDAQVFAHPGSRLLEYCEAA